MEIQAEKGLISLKEAAKISGYSPDYIGQLIRAGKIPGKQVCCTVAWMTTAEAVVAYKSKGKENAKSGLKDKIFEHWQQLKMELEIISLFFKTFKYSLPILLIIIILVSSFGMYAWSVAANAKEQIKARSQNVLEQNITF